MKKIAMCLLLGCLCLNLMAQSDSETKSMINKIKRSMSYLSAEATMPTEDEAMATAKELLVSEINEWVSSKKKGTEVKQVVLQDISSCTQLMDMKRGTRTRAFVYVKKKDIVLIYGEGQLVLNDDELQPLDSLSVLSETVRVQASTQVQSVDETPSLVEAVPVIAEEVIGFESSDVAEQIVTIEPTVVETPVPVVEKTPSPLEMILGARTMVDMKPVFATLKNAGKITYGVYSSDDVRQNCYLLFYDRSGNIKGVVKKSGESYTDARNGVAVSLVSYSGLGAYWFVLE